jgi:hypothetical protein
MATEAEIRTWIAGYRRAWDQLCQALMWQLAKRFGKIVSTPGSAYEAYAIEKRAGRIRTDVPAPAGSFVYFDIGRFDHVGFMLNGGRVFMTGKNIAEEWTQDDAGIQTIAEYCRKTGATYLGWSWQNGGNTVPFTPDAAPAPAPAPAATTWERAPGGETGAPMWPRGELMKRVQRALIGKNRLPADYKVDGIGGPLLAKAVQTTLNVSGRNGGVLIRDGAVKSAVDGKLGRYNAYGIQEYARDFGSYTGKQDGDPREGSWAGFALGLERP